MRTTFFAMVALIAVISVQAQDLRADALKLKREFPIQYGIIQEYSKEAMCRFPDLIIDEINAQCEAYYMLVGYITKYKNDEYIKKLIAQTLIEESIEGWEQHNKKEMSNGKIALMHVNWEAVVSWVAYKIKHR